MTESDDETLHTTTGSSARCGTTSKTTDPSPKEQMQSTALLRTISCTGRTHSPAATPDLFAPLRTTGCPGHIACSLAGSLRLSGQQAAQDTSSAESPELCATPDIHLPRRTHSPAAPPHHSAHLHRPTTPAPKRQWPAAKATSLLTIWHAADQHDTGSPAQQHSNKTSHTNSVSKDYTLQAHCTLPRSVHHLTSFSPRGRGVKWGHPHDSTCPSSLRLSSQQRSLCLTPATAPHYPKPSTTFHQSKRSLAPAISVLLAKRPLLPRQTGTDAAGHAHQLHRLSNGTADLPTEVWIKEATCPS
jgi:hypothetical protein